jgi:hypothetical protein
MNRRRLGCAALGVGGLFIASSARAQTSTTHAPHVAVRASRTATPPVIDGRLTDEPWAQAEPISGLMQLEPDEGQPSTERTEIRILYDDNAVYVAARMFDSRAGGISRRLSSRDDEPDADKISVFFDPMHDHLTGVAFQVSAAGVQQDSIVHNDTWTDRSWDAVWTAAVSADAEGWSAEIRIPLSQLRFQSADRQTWGFNFQRYIRRRNENDWLELVPKAENGLASRMAHISGFDGVQPRRHVELLPYTAARAEVVEPARPGDPFNDGARAFGSAGIDVKWGLTNAVTLDGTFNPDFGQVEVDPAVVNLTAFETFFQEKRPFFLEGAQIFGNFGQGGATGNWGFNSSDPNIFYSRRIGRAPQVAASGDFVDPPGATTILGAAKLSGKLRGGWSIGLLEAVTGREDARVRAGTLNSRTAVEPLTNYLVARVKRDGRRAGAGLIATAVHRRLDVPNLQDNLAAHAFVGGVDGYYFLGDGLNWVIAGKLAGSRIDGSTDAIDRAQLAPQRYYQRPDATHVSYDPSRTSLGGFNGRVHLNRNSGLWQVNAALWSVSPGFESNDLGFLGSADRAGAHGVFSLRNVTPGRVVRERNAWIAKFWTWNFNRELQTDGAMGRVNFQFLNYWNIGTGAGVFRGVRDDQLTRGGPSAAKPPSQFWNFSLNSDSRKWLSFETETGFDWNGAAGSTAGVGVQFSVKPSPKLTVSTGPQFNSSETTAQYVRTVVDPTATGTYGERYVFGAIDQKQLTLTTRVNMIFSPRHSLQIFAQPLLAAGDYSDFKELARPRTYDFYHYGMPASSLLSDGASGLYTIDPDRSGPAPAFTFGNPDFNFKSLRLNAVFRWELKPGSAFYAVWTRQQQDFAHPGDFAFRRDTGALFSAPGDDVFLVKVAYWMGR